MRKARLRAVCSCVDVMSNYLLVIHPPQADGYFL